MKKKSVAFLCAVLLLSMSVTAYAQTPVKVADPIVITPFWTNAQVITVGLSFTNGKGTLGASVIGQVGTTKITGSALLERQNADGTYSHVNTWTNLAVDGDYLLWGTDYYVSRGHTYRLTITATVYRNGTSETVSLSKSAYAD